MQYIFHEDGVAGGYRRGGVPTLRPIKYVMCYQAFYRRGEVPAADMF